MKTSMKRLARKPLVWVTVAIVIVAGCYGAVTLRAAAPPEQVAPAWLQAIALDALQANTSPSDSEAVTVQWTLTTYGQYGQAVPVDAFDTSVASEAVYVVVLHGPITSAVASSLTGKPVTGDYLVFTVDGVTHHTISQVVLPKTRAPDFSPLGAMNTIAH